MTNRTLQFGSNDSSGLPGDFVVQCSAPRGFLLPPVARHCRQRSKRYRRSYAATSPGDLVVCNPIRTGMCEKRVSRVSISRNWEWLWKSVRSAER